MRTTLGKGFFEKKNCETAVSADRMANLLGWPFCNSPVTLKPLFPIYIAWWYTFLKIDHVCETAVSACTAVLNNCNALWTDQFKPLRESASQQMCPVHQWWFHTHASVCLFSRCSRMAVASCRSPGTHRRGLVRCYNLMSSEYWWKWKYWRKKSQIEIKRSSTPVGYLNCPLSANLLPTCIAQVRYEVTGLLICPILCNTCIRHDNVVWGIIIMCDT